MLLNKWAQLALSIAIIVYGALIAVDWTQYVSPSVAGYIVTGLGMVKLVFNLLAPNAKTPTSPTGNAIITHTADK